MPPSLTSKPDIDVDQLVTTLGRLRGQFGVDEEEFGFLANYLHDPILRNLIQVHDLVSRQSSPQAFQPTVSSAEHIALEVAGEIQMKGLSTDEALELFHLLQSPHLMSVLSAHDIVAQKEFVPRLPELPPDLDSDSEETVKIVQLVKSSEALGATIKADERTGAIVIARVMHGGAADRSGLIHVGDEVLEVNDIDVSDKSPNDVLRILTQAQGTITFKLIPADTRRSVCESRVRVRALFDYCASDDQHIPCREAGLDFRRGDVLHIVAQDDIYWWQARLEGDSTMRSGLIPSRALQERRFSAARSTRSGNQPGGGRSSFSGSTCSSPALSKVTKIMYNALDCDNFDSEEMVTYEEVARLYPRPGYQQRPLVLVGPRGVGRSELQKRLVTAAPDKYRGVVAYTSRPQRIGENNGVDYQFVSRADMDHAVTQGQFVEYGERDGHLYGTSMESIIALVDRGLVCVLCPHHQALKMIRTAEIRPYLVFIKPPLFQKLKETRIQADAKSPFDTTRSRGFTDEELHSMIRSGERLEHHYGHLFDHVLVNENITATLAQLLRIVARLESEPMWVPVSWVQ